MPVQNLEALVQQFENSSEDQKRDLLIAIQEKEHSLRILNKFAVSLIEISSLDDLYWFVAKEVVGQLGFVDCVIYEFDGSLGTLRQRAAMGDKSPEGRMLLNPMIIPLGKGVTGRTAKARQPTIVKDLSLFDDYVQDLNPARSEICVPLLHGTELLGVIDCEDPRAGHFTDEHKDILVMVASMTSSKIKECRVVKKLAEQAQVMRQVREAVVVTDMEGKIIDCNGGAIALYEYERDQLIGRRVPDMLANSDVWEFAHPARAEALDSKGLWRGLEKIKTGTGSVIIVDISLTPVTDDYGNRIATIGVGRDVTAFEEAKAALTAQNEALEKALGESAAAKSESRAKDAFLANTSHELRTPLTGLVGMIDLLSGTNLSDEQKDLLNAASNSAHALSAIIDDILDLAKMEAGKLSLTSQPFDPVALVDAAFKTMVPAASAKGLAFSCTLPSPGHDWVEGDANRIRQVLFNLLGNAIKFTDEGAVKLAFDMTEREGKHILSMAVSDTGPGFSPAAFNRIFERFQQLDTSSRKSAGGAGLGLAISRELAEMMGGAITVESREGEGSTFRFEVALKKCSQPDVAADGRLVGRSFDKTLNILVVEDNPINQVLISRILSKEGWTAEIAANGQLALDRLGSSEAAFDLILMDIRMPVMDGVEATRHIRACKDGRANIPIIALTANTSEPDREEYSACGMNAIVAKPIDQSLLVETIENCVSRNT